MSLQNFNGPANLPTNLSIFNVTSSTTTGRTKPTRTLRIGSVICEPERLMTLLASLQIADPENIVRLAYSRSLHTFCTKVGLKLEETYKYLKSCYMPPQQRLYANLIDGVNSLYDTLCMDPRYKHKFEGFSACFRELYTEIDNCDGPKDWAEDSNKTRLCQAYENIVDCYMIKTALICGPKAADVFKRLLINVLRSTVVTDCGIRTRKIREPNVEIPLMSQRTFNIIYLVIISILLVAMMLLIFKKAK